MDGYDVRIVVEEGVLEHVGFFEDDPSPELFAANGQAGRVALDLLEGVDELPAARTAAALRRWLDARRPREGVVQIIPSE